MEANRGGEVTRTRVVEDKGEVNVEENAKVGWLLDHRGPRIHVDEMRDQHENGRH